MEREREREREEKKQRENEKQHEIEKWIDREGDSQRKETEEKETERERERDSSPLPPAAPWAGSLCHPCITTTHLSNSFLSLKLPPPPCAVLPVTIICNCTPDFTCLFHPTSQTVYTIVFAQCVGIACGSKRYLIILGNSWLLQMGLTYKSWIVMGSPTSMALWTRAWNLSPPAIHGCYRSRSGNIIALI